MSDPHLSDWRLAPALAAAIGPAATSAGHLGVKSQTLGTGALLASELRWTLRQSRTGTGERLTRGMFDFGRGLRKLFRSSEEAEDFGWLELVGPELLAREARSQCIDAGRVSCTKPFQDWMRGAMLWREHARRTGARESLDRAASAAKDAIRAARTREETIRAEIEASLCLMTRFDLCGGRVTLDQALKQAPTEQLINDRGIRQCTGAWLAALHARLRLRQARLIDEQVVLLRAAALMDAAIQVVDTTRAGSSAELRLERAALALENGVMRRDAALLDQAGDELRQLVANADPDRLPLSRSRALSLCAAGLSALASLAGDEIARVQARDLFDSAAEQFTPDHSPLDWIAIQVSRSADHGLVPLANLRQAETLGGGQGLLLGALARDRRLEVEIQRAVAAGDTSLLDTLRKAIIARLSLSHGRSASVDLTDAGDLDWAVDQVALAQLDLAKARLTGRLPAFSGFGLFEAAEVARDRGLPELAARAEALMPGRWSDQ